MTVEGYELETTDNINYKLNVNNQVDKIVIKAVLEDSKATLTGVGEQKLNVGDNTFKIVDSFSKTEDEINCGGLIKKKK